VGYSLGGGACSAAIMGLTTILLAPWQAHAQWAFHCPEAGTVVTYELAGKMNTVSYEGADPTNGELCVRSVNGQRGRMFFGMVGMGNANAVDLTSAYREVLSGPHGKRAQTSNYGPTGVVSLVHEFRNEGVDILEIGGERRQIVRIADTQTTFGRGALQLTWRFSFDLQTGAVLRVLFQQDAGHRPAYVPADTDWTATSIKVPKP